MMRLVCAAVLTLLIAAPMARVSAQLLKAEAPIRVGHYHLNVTSIDEHKKFWVDAMGGTATKVGTTDAVRFGDVFLLLRPQKPTGPTRYSKRPYTGDGAAGVPALAPAAVSRPTVRP